MDSLKQKYALSRKYAGFINISPIQTGAILPEEAERATKEFIVGYAPYNLAQGIEIMDIPVVRDFIENDLPGFLNADRVRITFGAREGIYIAMKTAAKPGSTVLVDENSHYTTFVAAEKAGLNVEIVKSSGYPEYAISTQDYEEAIRKHKPSAVLLTYPDGNYGNLPDPEPLAKLAHENSIPFILNCAYSMGRMPLDMKKLKPDFMVGSGHKSMASIGPIGIIAATEKWSEKMLKKSLHHKKSELEFMGSEIRGTPLISLMASFPYVYERVKKWPSEVEKARWFSRKMDMLGLVQLGEKPHNHDLMKFRTDPFYEISKLHHKKRAFLYEHLKSRGITGIQHGKTKAIKLSTYGISKDSLKKVLSAFEDIVDTY